MSARQGRKRNSKAANNSSPRSHQSKNSFSTGAYGSPVALLKDETEVSLPSKKESQSRFNKSRVSDLAFGDSINGSVVQSEKGKASFKQPAPLPATIHSNGVKDYPDSVQNSQSTPKRKKKRRKTEQMDAGDS